MLGREIDVTEVLRDIKDGKGDGELMQKYRLSPRGLADLYRKLVNTGFLARNGNSFVIARSRRIAVKQLVADLRAGLSRQELMAKYLCSSQRLRRLVAKLMAVGVVTQTELAESEHLADWAEFQLTPRLPRNYLPYPFPVHALGDPNATGLIIDITEHGLKVEGIDVRVGEVRRLSIIVTDVSEVRPFFLKARCRWVTKDPPKASAAGFEIQEITDSSLQELRKFIQALTPSAW
jgi:uncharacterized protein (DUF433 family)